MLDGNKVIVTVALNGGQPVNLGSVAAGQTVNFSFDVNSGECTAGQQLAYTVVRPAKAGRYPTLFEYSGYNPGRDPDAAYIQRFVESQGHYAYIGVNLDGVFFGLREAIPLLERTNGAVVVTSSMEKASTSASGKSSGNGPGCTDGKPVPCGKYSDRKRASCNARGDAMPPHSSISRA